MIFEGCVDCIRTPSAAIASVRVNNLATHPFNLATHPSSNVFLTALSPLG